MSKLTAEEIQTIAARAMLTVSEEEAQMYAEKLDVFNDYKNKLDELNAERVEPMTHALQNEDVMREDKVSDVLDREAMLENVKESKDGEIKVPTIL